MKKTIALAVMLVMCNAVSAETLFFTNNELATRRTGSIIPYDTPCGKAQYCESPPCNIYAIAFTWYTNEDVYCWANPYGGINATWQTCEDGVLVDHSVINEQLDAWSWNNAGYAYRLGEYPIVSLNSTMWWDECAPRDENPKVPEFSWVGVAAILGVVGFAMLRR